MARKRIPEHVGFIPDGNRRWASSRNLPKQEGYAAGIAPGIQLTDRCLELDIPEVSIYGFTADNTKRPARQQAAFIEACISFAYSVSERGVALLVVGNDKSPVFPDELRRWCTRQGTGMRVNMLCNYSWQWDLDGLKNGGLRSADVSRLELIVRWGGGRRLSGFLPVQSVYADFFVLDEYWPDFQPAHLESALEWFGKQDRTLGG